MPKIGITTKPKKLRALGITCGIGSMLVGARQAGFEVLGNIEWRKYYHRKDSKGRNTFQENFPGAILRYNDGELTDEETKKLTGVDLLMGHPECGAFSNLRNVKSKHYDDPCDIPLFVELVAKFKPRFFVMDDLPPSFEAYPMAKYVDLLSDYDLFPEWISNYHYGNVQKHRKRLFMIGSLKSERWSFRPGELSDMTNSMESTIGDLCDEEGFAKTGFPNHQNHVLDVESGRALHLLGHGKRATWRDVRGWFLDQPPGKIMEYHASDGTVKVRFGLARTHWEDHCHVITGTNPTIHPISGLPMTVRERARIQGFPDDFVFYGEVLEDDGTWNHDRNNPMIKQTGKAMPVQFCRYVAEQVRSHILGVDFECSGMRTLTPNKYVDQAKRWYCSNIGYSDQQSACEECWMYGSCDIRGPRYGIGGKIVEEVASHRYELPVVDQEPSKKPDIAVDVPSVTRPTKKRRTWSRVVRSSSDPLEIVEERSERPDDYPCECRYCTSVVELIRPNGIYYSRNDRRYYYSPVETAKGDGSGHIAKTPLHVARWAIQQFTKPGDWVLDPTAGAGTTLVESITHGRNALGIEIQTANVVRANIAHVQSSYGANSKGIVVSGDAREIGKHLSRMKFPKKFQLVVNNPPYSGDESQIAKGSSGYKYDQAKENLAFLDEGPEYYETLREVYSTCVAYLAVGGTFVMAVKDQMRNKEPDQLHEKIGDVLSSIPGLEFERTAVLNHYPRTLHLNTYFQHHGVHPPYYQSILVFRKVK